MGADIQQQIAVLQMSDRPVSAAGSRMQDEQLGQVAALPLALRSPHDLHVHEVADGEKLIEASAAEDRSPWIERSRKRESAKRARLQQIVVSDLPTRSPAADCREPPKIRFSCPDRDRTAIVRRYRIAPGVDLARPALIEEALEMTVRYVVRIAVRTELSFEQLHAAEIVLLPGLGLPRRLATAIKAEQTAQRNALEENLLLAST
jgi:hypothetical protein